MKPSRAGKRFGVRKTCGLGALLPGTNSRVRNRYPWPAAGFHHVCPTGAVGGNTSLAASGLWFVSTADRRVGRRAMTPIR